MAQVIEEGRNAIQGFRLTESETQELAEAFSSVPQELNLQEQIDFRVITEGHPLSLLPLIRDDIYLIGREALVNAFRHARATAIEVEVEYSPNRLRVLVRDNGSGMDTEMLQRGRDRHWGLSGMGERAKRIGAKFKVLSRPGAGTEVELCVPARVAFQSHGGNPVSRHAESPAAPPEIAATAKKQ
jgi:signal transduction histidine kinase